MLFRLVSVKPEPMGSSRYPRAEDIIVIVISSSPMAWRWPAKDGAPHPLHYFSLQAAEMIAWFRSDGWQPKCLLNLHGCMGLKPDLKSSGQHSKGLRFVMTTLLAQAWESEPDLRRLAQKLQLVAWKN